MRLVSFIERYGQTVQSTLERLGEEPITFWVEMKQKLKEKYVPTYHKRHLLDQ